MITVTASTVAARVFADYEAQPVLDIVGVPFAVIIEDEARRRQNEVGEPLNIGIAEYGEDDYRRHEERSRNATTMTRRSITVVERRPERQPFRGDGTATGSCTGTLGVG